MTLQEFLFENNRSAPVSAVLRKLKYCVEYRYLVEILKRYMADRGLAEVGYEEFRGVIGRIDSEVMARHNADELSRLLKPLVEFVDMGIPDTPVSETGPLLPINAAIVFFEDKKMDDLRVRLEAERDQAGVVELSLSDLARLLREAKGEPEPVPEEPPPAPIPEVIEPPAMVEKPVAEVKSETRKHKEPPAGSDGRATRPVEDLYAMFNVKEQRRFVRKLFRKDEVEFRRALDRLNPVQTWEEASLQLDALFASLDVDPFSREAVLFTEKIFSRYAVADQTRK